jgi:hypothetical protein
MPKYKDQQNNVHHLDDAAFAHLLPAGCVQITDEEAEALRPVAVPAIPQVVSRFQARAALHLAGLLDDVEAMMTSPETPVLAKLAWADAQEFKRNSPSLLGIAGALALTDAQLDELFTTAAGIEA